MKPEGRFKLRADTTARRIAKAAGVPLEFGAKVGDPDKIYKFGTVWLAVEHKRAGKAPRKLQEHRLAELDKLGLPGCALIASKTDDYTQEKQDFYNELLAVVDPVNVERHLNTYRQQADQLRRALEGLLGA